MASKFKAAQILHNYTQMQCNIRAATDIGADVGQSCIFMCYCFIKHNLEEIQSCSDQL